MKYFGDSDRGRSRFVGLDLIDYKSQSHIVRLENNE